MRLALTSASGCSVCIWHTTTSSSRAGETSPCSAWGLTWHPSPLQDGASRVASQGILGSIHPGIVAPWHLSHYHCFAYTRPGAKAPGFQPVAVSVQIPIDVPPVDLQQRFDPKDYSGSGVEGSRASDIVVSGNEVYAEGLVEERPALLSAPALVYPALLKQAGIQGRVILPAVIDTTGRVEPASVRIMKSSDPAFDQPTKDWVLKALFRPARLHGRGVRVFINLLVDYAITPSSGSP